MTGRLLLCLFLTGCATSKVNQKYLFTCGIMGLGGQTYVNLKVVAEDKGDALRDTVLAQERLQKRGLIPNDAYSICFEGEEVDSE